MSAGAAPHLRLAALRLGCAVEALTGAPRTVCVPATLPTRADLAWTHAATMAEVLCITRVLGGPTVLRHHPAPTRAVQRVLDAAPVAEAARVEDLLALDGGGVRALGAEVTFFCLDAEAFRPHHHLHAVRALRPMDPHDARALEALRAATPTAQRVLVTAAHDPIFGVFDDASNALLAAASLVPFEDAGIATASVLVHPDWRARGLGRAVSSAAVAWALTNNLAVEWSTWADNAASRRLALSLGFEPWAIEAELELSPRFDDPR